MDPPNVSCSTTAEKGSWNVFKFGNCTIDSFTSYRDIDSTKYTREIWLYVFHTHYRPTSKIVFDVEPPYCDWCMLLSILTCGKPNSCDSCLLLTPGNLIQMLWHLTNISIGQNVTNMWVWSRNNANKKWKRRSNLTIAILSTCLWKHSLTRNILMWLTQIDVCFNLQHNKKATEFFRFGNLILMVSHLREISIQQNLISRQYLWSIVSMISKSM